MDLWRATPRSGFISRFDLWSPPCQLIVSMFSSNFLSVAAGDIVCQVFVCWLLVPQEPCECRLLMDNVVFPTEQPPGVQGGDEISMTGCGSMKNQDFGALRMPRSFRESILCV